MSIQTRLIEMLTERGIRSEFVVHIKGPKIWSIFYYNNPDDVDDYKTINHDSLVSDQDWMELPILSGEEATQAIGYERWLKDLDMIFNEAFGAGHECFDDYNWWDEYESEHSPEDAFEEWKLQQPSNLGC